jgi:O-antigen ligase
LATVLSVLVIYFVTANSLKSAVEIKKLWTAVIVGGFITAIITFLQGMGVFILPFAITQGSAFNTVGTITSVGVYLVTIFALTSGALLYDHHLAEGSKYKISNILHAIISIVSLMVVIIVDFWPVTLSLLIVSLLLIAFSYIHAKSAKNLRGVILPLAAVVIAILLFVFNLPSSARFSFPAEVLPTIKSSLNISVQALKENPVLGTGPGTFVVDYAKYRQQSINNSNFWNVRFDRSGSDVLTMLATNGILGLLAWLVMVVMVLVLSVKAFLGSDERTQHFLVGIIAAWLGLVLGRIFYSSSITLDFMFWIITAMIVAVIITNVKTHNLKAAPKMGILAMFATVVVAGSQWAFILGVRG